VETGAAGEILGLTDSRMKPTFLQILGRFLQASGLILAPMALFYYFDNVGKADEGRLASMELTILASAAAIFLLGRFLSR
jgi:hypothetical protein